MIIGSLNANSDRDVSTKTFGVPKRGAPCPFPPPRNTRVRKIKLPITPSGTMIIFDDRAASSTMSHCNSLKTGV